MLTLVVFRAKSLVAQRAFELWMFCRGVRQACLLRAERDSAHSAIVLCAKAGCVMKAEMEPHLTRQRALPLDWPDGKLLRLNIFGEGRHAEPHRYASARAQPATHYRHTPFRSNCLSTQTQSHHLQGRTNCLPVQRRWWTRNFALFARFA